MRRRSLLAGVGSLGLGVALSPFGGAVAAEGAERVPIVYGYLA
ncbi:MAG: hypothetical protein JWQ89_2988, partial [Devosia sp.]|nr:hypothetical protein [Devosia sp.]